MLRSLRLGWGCLLIVLPRQLLRLLGAGQTHSVVIAARVLGARHLIEGGAMAFERRGQPPVWISAADVLHALSMLSLATACPRFRRPALASATGAVSLLACSARVAVKGPSVVR